MTEELAFDEVLWKRRTVDGHQRTLAPALCVDLACDELLSHAALTEHEDRDLHGRRTIDGHPRHRHRGAVPHERRWASLRGRQRLDRFVSEALEEDDVRPDAQDVTRGERTCVDAFAVQEGAVSTPQIAHGWLTALPLDRRVRARHLRVVEGEIGVTANPPQPNPSRRHGHRSPRGPAGTVEHDNPMRTFRPDFSGGGGHRGVAGHAQTLPRSVDECDA